MAGERASKAATYSATPSVAIASACPHASSSSKRATRARFDLRSATTEAGRSDPPAASASAAASGAALGPASAA
jgi:hypothetical protein